MHEGNSYETEAERIWYRDRGHMRRFLGGSSFLGPKWVPNAYGC
jgi:hypothetical protein